MDYDLPSFDAFMTHFNTEEVCADYLFHVKWSNGFVCPRCDHRHFYMTTTRRLPLYECAQCRYQASLTVGTVMEGSSTNLQKWFIAFYLISQPTKGISALHLSKKIHATYKTAWTMLHKIRHAMGEEDSSTLLSGIVQVNDAWHGEPDATLCKRQSAEHPLFIGASMNEEEKPVYLKIKLLLEEYLRDWHVLKEGQKAFISEHVQAEETNVLFITGRFKSTRYKKLMPYFRMAKRWMKSTFRGIGLLHLQAYLDEFCGRLNLMWQNSSIFRGLIQVCTKHKKITYDWLTVGGIRGMKSLTYQMIKCF